MSKRREGPEALASLPGTLTESAEIRPPSHLSRRSQADYRALHETHVFAPHERLTLVRYLEWLDRRDALMVEAEKLSGRERAARVKASGDCATVALRFWRGLKFLDPSRPPRIGRPPGRRPHLPVSSLTIRGGTDGADGAR